MKKISKKIWEKLQNVLPKKLRIKKRPSVRQVITELYQQGRLQEAATLAIKSTELYPEKWFFHHIAGNALKGLGHEKEACKYLNSAFTLYPEHPLTSSQLINTIATSKNFLQLAEEFSHSLSEACISTTDSVAVNRLMSAIAASENLERAAHVYSQYYQNAGYSPEIVIGAIRTVRDWANLTHAPLLEVGEIEMIPFRAPVVYGTPASSEIIYGHSNKPYVAEIANARIFSHSNLILTSEGTVLSDDAGHEKFGEYVSFEYEKKLVIRQKNRLLLDLTKYKERKIDAAIFLAGSGSDQFGHWFPEFLPRIQFFRQHPEFEKLPIIVDADMPKSHFEHLCRMVGNELILLQADESLACKRLLVASSPTFLPVHLTVESLKPHDVPGLSPRALQFLKDELSFNEATKPHRRIFLARANMQWRRMTNENEVAAALVKLGFEIIHLENMSAASQIEVFQQAEWIVAPNGSALLNTIFADSAAQILVLSQPNLFNWGAFQGPIEVLGYRPLFVCGEYAVEVNKKHSDYSISPELVKEALQYMGLLMPQNEKVATIS